MTVTGWTFAYRTAGGWMTTFLFRHHRNAVYQKKFLESFGFTEFGPITRVKLPTKKAK